MIKMANSVWRRRMATVSRSRRMRKYSHHHRETNAQGPRRHHHELRREPDDTLTNERLFIDMSGDNAPVDPMGSRSIARQRLRRRSGGMWSWIRTEAHRHAASAAIEHEHRFWGRDLKTL